MGGEEFVGIFSINRNYEASAIAERIRHLVENTVVTNSDGQELKVTISVGVTVSKPQDTPDDIIKEQIALCIRASIMEETWFPRMCQQKIFESKEYVKGKYYGIFSNLS